MKLKQRYNEQPCENCGEKPALMTSWEFGHQCMVCSSRCGYQLKFRIQMGKAEPYSFFDKLGEDEIAILIHRKSGFNKYPFSYKTVSKGKQLLRTQLKLLKNRLKNTKV